MHKCNETKIVTSGKCWKQLPDLPIQVLLARWKPFLSQTQIWEVESIYVGTQCVPSGQFALSQFDDPESNKKTIDVQEISSYFFLTNSYNNWWDKLQSFYIGTLITKGRNGLLHFIYKTYHSFVKQRKWNKYLRQW